MKHLAASVLKVQQKEELPKSTREKGSNPALTKPMVVSVPAPEDCAGLRRSLVL